jgi:hypothetical protein
VPWSHLRPFPIARPALQASTHWISNWPLLGVLRDRTMQGPLNAKVPDSGVCQNDLPPRHLDGMHRRENFPTASMLWRVHGSLVSVLRSLFILLPFFLSFQPVLCYTLRLCLSPSVHYVHIVRFIYLSHFHELYCMFSEALAFSRVCPILCISQAYAFSPPTLLICKFLFSIGCCLLLNLQCLPIIAQFER